MTTILQHLWPGLAVAALLGFSFSLVFGAGRGLPSARLDVKLGAALLLAAGLLLLWLELVPGRPGLWLDIGVLCCLAYAAGTAAGLPARLLFRRMTPAGGERSI